ncbi:MAG: trypsin-like serine protease [Chthoniobacterales bacterium]
MLDTKAESEYLAFASEFSASGTILAVRENGAFADTGTGTYLGEGWVLTAAHVVTGNRPSVTFRVGGITYSADLTTLSLHPNYFTEGTLFNDLAVFKLTLTPPVAPALIYDGGTMLGKPVAVVGAGSSGFGSTGYSPLSRLGTMRAGTNVIDGVGPGGTTLHSDFDAPAGYAYSGAGNGFANGVPTSLESLVVPGDSGGGWYISTPTGWALAGVSSSWTVWSGRSYGHYGDTNTAMSLPAYTGWLDSIGVNLTYASAVPEPSITALLLIAIGAVAYLKLRRQNHNL